MQTFFADNTIQTAANNVLNTSAVAGDTVEQALDNLGGGVGSVFGENVSTATDESTTATASTTPVDKVTLTTTTLNAGIYYVAYNCELTINTSNRNAACRLVRTTGGLNQEICFYSKERKDNDDNDNPSGFGIVVLPAGIEEFKIQFFREGGGGGAIVSCSRARIILYRIR